MMKTNPHIYISGKITGTIDGNKFKFKQTENALRYKYGTEVMIINPHSIQHDHDKTWEMYMRKDISAMLKCGSVVVLDDWRQSRGAVLEVLIAVWFGMPVYAASNLDRPLYFPRPLRLTLLLSFLFKQYHATLNTAK